MSDRQFSVAVVGATGAVGEALLAVLAERKFPVGKLYAVARDRSEDQSVLFAERPVLLDPIEDFDFSRCQLAFFCVPAAAAKKYAPKAVKAGCWVIDVSRQFRLDKHVPLAVPAVDRALLEALPPGRPCLIASPSAPAVQLATVLKPLAQRFGLRAVAATTLLAVSAKGKAGLNELAGQTARLLNAQAIRHKTFPSQIAFNLIPAFDAPDESGYTLEERGAAAELKKLLGQDRLDVTLTELFAPVFYGHSQVVCAHLAQPAGCAELRELLRGAEAIELDEAAEEPLTPVGIGTGSDTVAVGRICQSAADPTRVTLWSVADNVRKGAAVNAVEIAETLLKSHL